MTLTTRTVNIASDWTLITSKIAIVQFNDEMEILFVETGTVPTDAVGIRAGKMESVRNTAVETSLWAKSRLSGTNIESARVTELG